MNYDPYKNQGSAPTPFTLKTVTSQEGLNTMRDIAKKYGITIKILNKPLEEYTHASRSFDENTHKMQTKKITSSLEHNKYYIELIHPTADLSLFWKELDTLTPFKDPLIDLLDEHLDSLKKGTLEPGETEFLTHLVDKRIENETAKIKK